MTAEPEQTYRQWLEHYAALFHTTLEHVENMTRIVWPNGEGPLLRGPVPPIMLKYSWRLVAQFVKEYRELQAAINWSRDNGAVE